MTPEAQTSDIRQAERLVDLRATAPSTRWAIAAFVSAIAAGALLSFAPAVTSQSCRATTTGALRCSGSHESLIRSEGAGVVLILAVPVALTASLLLLNKRRVAAVPAAVLSALTVLGAASVGIFFIPSV